MEERIKSFFHKPWTIQIIGGVICGIIVLIISREHLTLISAIIAIINFISSSILIPIWLIVFLLILPFLTWGLWHYVLCRPPFLSYTNDIIDSILWRWKYIKSSTKSRYEISDLKCHCIECERELSEDGHYYVCNNENCNKKRCGDMDRIKEDEIIKTIKDRIRIKYPRAYRRLN